MIVHLMVLRAAALLVPRSERADWLAEWRSELWYVFAERPGRATAFCLGAFPDAFWLRCDSDSFKARRIFPESPLRCVLILAVLAGAGFLSARHRMGEIRVFPHILMILIALAVLPVVTSLDFGDYPANNCSLWRPVRRWMFFATKVVLLSAAVFWGALTLVSIGAAPILPQAVLVGYVLAFRWSVIDQRRRCPVCLQVLTNPVRIEQCSETFLAWHGTELICAQGHGVLQVPEVPTSCYSSQRWLDLDPI